MRQGASRRTEVLRQLRRAGGGVRLGAASAALFRGHTPAASASAAPCGVLSASLRRELQRPHLGRGAQDLCRHLRRPLRPQRSGLPGQCHPYAGLLLLLDLPPCALGPLGRRGRRVDGPGAGGAHPQAEAGDQRRPGGLPLRGRGRPAGAEHFAHPHQPGLRLLPLQLLLPVVCRGGGRGLPDPLPDGGGPLPGQDWGRDQDQRPGGPLHAAVQ